MLPTYAERAGSAAGEGGALQAAVGRGAGGTADADRGSAGGGWPRGAWWDLTVSNTVADDGAHSTAAGCASAD